MAFLSGVTSLVTHYARPFKRSRGMSMLEEGFVPTQYLSLHRLLIEARDKAHAHLDGDLGDASSGQVCHLIRLLKQRDAQHFWIPARLLAFDRRRIPEVQALVKALLAKLDSEMDVLQDLLLPQIKRLSAGIYILSDEAPYFTSDDRYDGIDEIDDIATIN